MNPINLPPPQTPQSRAPTIQTPTPRHFNPESPSPRRRNTVGQDARDLTFASFTNNRATAEKQTGYEDVVRLLDTVASATLEERTLTDSYESRIRELEAENAELMRVGRADNPLSTQAAKALAMVRSLQSTLFTEREGFAVREAGLTTRVWGLETAVTDSLRDLLRERRVREEVEWQVWPRGRDKEESMLDEIECRVCKVRQKQEEQGVVGRAEREQAQRREEEVQRREEEDSRRRREETLRRRGEDELKKTQAAAGEKMEVANDEIRALRKEIKALSMLKGHKEDTESELDMLKEGMKRIERIAMMYGPLEDEMGLLDAIETWKLEFLAVSTKRKKRRKKEEKHGLG
ncbi:hypothetical protein Q9L58_009857 [Maublancomyces gigas]|uniref:Uncharacterized protein n=1 Tax=Discina gigas TaxID=1032678 RepID=A0ABR3G5T6_9PEZI